MLHTGLTVIAKIFCLENVNVTTNIKGGTYNNSLFFASGVTCVAFFDFFSSLLFYMVQI